MHYRANVTLYRSLRENSLLAARSKCRVSERSAAPPRQPLKIQLRDVCGRAAGWRTVTGARALPKAEWRLLFQIGNICSLARWRSDCRAAGDSAACFRAQISPSHFQLWSILITTMDFKSKKKPKVLHLNLHDLFFHITNALKKLLLFARQPRIWPAIKYNLVLSNQSVWGCQLRLWGNFHYFLTKSFRQADSLECLSPVVW